MRKTIKIKQPNTRLLTLIALAAMYFLLPCTKGIAADRMYFSGFNETGAASSSREVVLVWGELEGTIPEEITAFNIYRKQGSADFETTPVAQINNGLVSETELLTFFDAPGETRDKQEMIAMLNDMADDTEINASNYAAMLHHILDETHEDYSRFKRMFLIRYSRNTAMACGRAWIDTAPGSEENSYIITGILNGTTETKPLGKTTVPASGETILPMPENFRQVQVGFCSEINKNIDNARVHLNWDIPTAPEKMALRTMVYGYDIYRSETDAGTLDLRTSIPASLVKINDVPVIVSGNTAADGADAFLAMDDNNVLDGGQGFSGGETLYYYIAARDLAGKYSYTAPPLKVTVPDTKPPAMPWNITAKQTMNKATNTPQLTLRWDQINAVNYIKYYNRDKKICSGSDTSVCYTGTNGNCETGPKYCVDIDVKEYHIYRFESFLAAREWGVDSDGDLWPDADETAAGTDPCDPSSSPVGDPAPLIKKIGKTQNILPLGTGKLMHSFTDTVPTADNTVYWYRLSASDFAGNQSALSPPIRGVLNNRVQPDVDTWIKARRCSYATKFLSVEECWSQYQDADRDAVLNIIDETGDARTFMVYEKCTRKIEYLKLLHRGEINPETGRGLLRVRDLPNYSCGNNLCTTYVVRFFGDKRNLLAETEPFESQSCLNSPTGCVILYRECTEIVIRPGDPEGPGALDPNEPFIICANLEPGECARVYRKINGKMSAVKTFCYNASGSCSGPIDITGIVANDICFGVRVTSENGVGSEMVYFDCIPILSLKDVKAPLMEGIYKKGDEADPSFEVRWSSQSAGISAFIISRESTTGIFYETLWDLDPDPATGQFSATLKIDPATIEDDWCFMVRAMDKTLTMSDWSQTRCKVWGTPEPGESLGWPAVKLPGDQGEITAVRITGNTAPALILSDDLTQKLIDLMDDCTPNRKTCLILDENPDGSSIPVCSEKTDCFKESILCCDLCSAVKTWNKIGKIVVYRQEEKKDFVQVSPLVETVHCSFTSVNSNRISTIKDPFIYLVEFGGGSIQRISTTDPAVKTSLEGSVRMIYADWFPYRQGTLVRYKVHVYGESSHEPEFVYTSGWLALP